MDHLPYLVELDNWGVSRQPGQAKAGGIWIWGYDEITWFAHQSQSDRSNWLRYARDWVGRTDPNGHLQMPGSRTLASPLDRKRWYYANLASPAVPEGLGDEAAIRAIWTADLATPRTRPPAPSSRQDLDRVLPVRGLCVAAPNPSLVEAFVRFIGEELAPRSVNTLILRVDFNYQYASRPELANRSGLSQADVKKMVAVCRTNQIRLIPQINLLGHQSWQRTNGKLLQV